MDGARDAGDVAGRHRVALLTERLARRLFGGQTQAIGQRIKLQGQQFDIVRDGVLVGATSMGPTGGEVLGLLTLAVHARVLAALSGEREIVTRYVARPGDRAGGQAGSQLAGQELPCRLGVP